MNEDMVWDLCTHCKVRMYVRVSVCTYVCTRYVCMYRYVRMLAPLVGFGMIRWLNGFLFGAVLH